MAPGEAKIGGKKSQKVVPSEPPLHPYEQLRLRQCMRNNSRLQQLGIPTLCNLLANSSSVSQKKNNPKYKNNEDSESDYDPSHDEIDAENSKGSKESNIRTAQMASGAIKPRSKRVFADQQTTRITRSKKICTQPDASKALGDFNVPSLSHVSPFREVGTFDGCPQATIQGDASSDAQVDDSTHTFNESNTITHLDGRFRMGCEDNNLVQLDGNMHNGGEAITELGVANQMDNEGHSICLFTIL